MDDGWRRLWDFDDPAGSETRFRFAVDAAAGVDRQILLTQLARSLGLQQRYDEGHAILDGITSAEPTVAVRVELERGRLFRSSGRPADSVEPFRRAAMLARTSGQEEAELDAMHMMALVVPAEEQVAVTEAAIDRAREARRPTGAQLVRGTAQQSRDDPRRRR